MESKWQPSWWSDVDGSAWERVREALRRDWEQTKHDLRLAGGHELNQDLTDTVQQATGNDAIPPDNRPNPPRVIGTWDDVELPVGYGYGARGKYGVEHPTWDPDIEAQLRGEWEASGAAPARPWDDVKSHVRRGYEYEPRG